MRVLASKQDRARRADIVALLATFMHLVIDDPPVAVTAMPGTLALMNAGQSQSGALRRRPGPANFGSRRPRAKRSGLAMRGIRYSELRSAVAAGLCEATCAQPAQGRCATMATDLPVVT
jgi:hypothetical protein